MVSEILRLDAVGQAEAIQAGEVSAAELIDAAATRAEAVDEVINFVVTPLYDEAIAHAKGSRNDSPLAGIPVMLKDFLATCAGVRHTEGSAYLSDYVAPSDSGYVARLRAAGANILGIVSTPEMALMCTTEPRIFGPTHNPWKRGYTPGGSSGASAAAVAAGVVAAAHGNDVGGSLRTPASCCGVVGLKPTRARNTLGPEYGDLTAGLWTEHVLTRSVRDSAAFLDATAGPMLGDPYCAPSPHSPFLADCDVEPDQLRIAFSTEGPTGSLVTAECRDATERAANLLVELGHEVQEDAPSFDAPLAETEFFALFCEGLAARLDSWVDRRGRKPRPGDFEPYTVALASLGRGRTGADHLNGVNRLQRECRRFAQFFQTYDVWLTPTLGMAPVELGRFDMGEGKSAEDVLRLEGSFSPFAWTANVTGQPAISLPYEFAGGLPIGIHLTAGFGDERTLLRVSSQLERVRGSVSPIADPTDPNYLRDPQDSASAARGRYC